MKKNLLLFIFVFLIGLSGRSFSQDIPSNFYQNPNLEHTLNPIFWYGSWDWVYWNNSIAWLPDFWITDTTEAHSGTKSLVITENSWVWPTVTTVGFEEQDMKMSFWFKSPVGNMAYWMFFYRDAGLSPADIRAPIPDAYIGYDTAYVTQQTEGDEVNDESMYFVMRGPYPEWTYFEFTFSYPGAGSFTSGWPAVTTMFWSEYTPGFVDDIYYGLDFEGVYNGEEDIELRNGDFENALLGYDWSTNLWVDSEIEVLNSDENHTENGTQSLSMWDDITTAYYMPALGTDGKKMDLSFWYKGHGGAMDLFVYDDFGLTVDDFPGPEGTELLAQKYTPDTTNTEIDSTIVWDFTTIVSADTAVNVMITPPETVTMEDFEALDGDKPDLIDWVWSGADLFGYNAWGDFVVDDDSYSGAESAWIPGDPNWTGAEGTLPGIEDGGAYQISFMYTGKLQFMLNIGSSLKYDLANDPEGIVPDDAEVDEGSIVWMLDSEEWTDFSFAWEVGTWLADSSVTSPAGLVYQLVGTYTEGDVGYVDDIDFAEVMVPVNILAKQNFDTVSGQPMPLDWCWSGASLFGYNDWANFMVDDEAYSVTQSIWLPGDPNWTGAEGTINGIADAYAYEVSFMYKGDLQFMLGIGGSLKYDLDNDPEGIIPDKAEVDEGNIVWQLSSEEWKKFSFAWEQGSWLADSSVASPAGLVFQFVGTYTDGDNGYADNLMALMSKEMTGVESMIETVLLIDAVYAIDEILIDTIYTIDTITSEVVVGMDSDMEPLAIHWTLPAATEWTEFTYSWTNPSGDIGSTLTMLLSADEMTDTDSIIYFDDFMYGVDVTSVESIKEKALHLYPNPVIDVMHLSVTDPLMNITIYNSLGQMVKNLNNPPRKVDVSDLSSGMYLINVTDDKGYKYTSKFIKK